MAVIVVLIIIIILLMMVARFFYVRFSVLDTKFTHSKKFTFNSKFLFIAVDRAIEPVTRPTLPKCWGLY
jgi:hypothetical protein